MCALALFIGLGILDCTLKEKFSRAEYGDCAMPDGPDKERLHKLMKKHGIYYNMTLVHDWPSNPWYYDSKGRRIKLK